MLLNAYTSIKALANGIALNCSGKSNQTPMVLSKSGLTAEFVTIFIYGAEQYDIYLSTMKAYFGYSLETRSEPDAYYKHHEIDSLIKAKIKNKKGGFSTKNALVTLSKNGVTKTLEFKTPLLLIDDGIYKREVMVKLHIDTNKEKDLKASLEFIFWTDESYLLEAYKANNPQVVAFLDKEINEFIKEIKTS